MGYVHQNTTHNSHPIGHRPTLRNAMPTLVDHSGGQKAMQARLHSPLQTTQTKSSHGNTQKPPLHLIIQTPFLNAKARGARTANVDTALHSHIRNSSNEGITILKFIYGQLYNGKLAYKYGLAPTYACPLCGLPDSCTHIAGQFSHHTNHIISKHNAACQLTHAAIKTAFKGGGTIYSSHDLRLVSSDAGNEHQTLDEHLKAFTFPPSQDHDYHSQK
jgi:hypothetical protein